MAAEGPGRGERPDDADDIDARFAEIVAGLRSEQEASSRRRAEAIRRAEIQRRSRESQNRPLEGFDRPNPWPPVPGGDQGSTPHARPTDPPSDPGAGPTDPPSAPGAEPTDPPSARDAPADPGAAPGRHRQPEPSPRPTPGSDSGPGEETPAGPSWRGWEESDEEEHFIPPTPSLPAGDLHLWAIVIGLLGGPILLILSEVFHVLRQGWWTPLGIVLSVAGVVLLVLRLPRNRDYPDSSGGAQV